MSQLRLDGEPQVMARSIPQSVWIDRRPRPWCRLAAVLLALGASALALAASDAAPTRTSLEREFDQQIQPFLATYCLDCHGGSKPKADLDLSRYRSGSAALAAADVWADSAKRVHGHEMPPTKEARQPSAVERARFIAWARGLRRLTPPDPGPGQMRRLSSLEYANTLRDLLGVDPALAAGIPQDQVGAGFSGSLPPLLMEKYLLVADAVLDQVIVPDQLRMQWQAGQLDAVVEGKHESGTAHGTERRLVGPAELFIPISAPVDGTYTLRLRAASEKLPTAEPTILAVRVDGQLVGQLKVTAVPRSPRTYTAKAKLLTGRSTISLLVANPLLELPGVPARGTIPAQPPQTLARTLIVDQVEVAGPPATRPSEFQRRLFVAQPSEVPGKELSERDAARRIAESFATRAYRRLVTGDEIDTLLKVFDLADGQNEVFANAVKLMLKAVLVSPAFLHLTPDGAAPAGADIVALGPYQLASRLSYLFWATMPDEELLARAGDGTLREPAVLRSQIKRLIADPRSQVLFRSFGAPWLGVDRLAIQTFDERKFPLMNRELRAAMYQEAELLFDTILREQRSLSEFVDNDYTFMNGTLARVYGLEATVKGPQFVRVTLSDRNRGGVLTLPGVLAATSHAARTSPVKRGAWILDQVLGQTPPPPPMNVPPLEKQDTVDQSGLSLRQRTERHRSDPACAGCHRTIDPLGFGLENFDAIGRWRDRDDTGQAVDAAGELPDGQTFRTPQDLKRLLAARQDDLCRALVGKVLSHALCRAPTAYDEVVADGIAAAVARDGYRFHDVWLHVAMSYPFLNRRVTR